MRSDQLATLAEILRRTEPFKSGTTIVHATLILDANIIIKELIWLCQKRRKADARSMLLELVECATVKAYAPTYLTTEIENHFATLEHERGLPPLAAREAWERFRVRITFIDVGDPDPLFPGVTDPKDVPYVRLQQQLPVPIVSDDLDLARMGATVIQIQLFAPLRAYSRQRAIEFQIKVAGLGAVFAAGLAAKVALEGARAVTNVISNLPKPVLAVAAVVALIAVLHPDSRRWMLDKLDRAAVIGGHVAEGFYDVVMPVVHEHYAAKLAADEGLAAVEALLTQLGIPPASVLKAQLAAPARRQPQKPRKRSTRRKQPAAPPSA